MSGTVLYECFNLGLAKGTGIKTYVQSLAQAARNLGYSVEALFQSEAAPRVSASEASKEIALAKGRGRNDGKLKYVAAPLKYAVARLDNAIGRPFGIAASTIARPSTSAARLGSEIDQYDPLFEKTHYVRRLSALARQHFNRYGGLARINLRSAPDIFHVTHPIPITIKNAMSVFTIHDVIPLKLPFATLDNKRYFLNVIREICEKADKIVTVSEASKRDILSVAPIREEKIAVTYQCTNIPPAFVARPENEIENILSSEFGLRFNEYFLFFGALEPKKNVSRLIDAHAKSRVKTPLVIAGGLGWSFDDVLRKIEHEQLSAPRGDGDATGPRIRRFDYLPLSPLAALIQGARAVLFPSLYEGFGLPVLEAMTIGAPVMTSNVSSLPELAGNAAILVDPYNVDEMAEAIARLDRDATLRRELSARGKERAKLFSREKYENTIRNLYSSLT
jgi:glycosyltransferase involved in cell wall biosynthesis